MAFFNEGLCRPPEKIFTLPTPGDFVRIHDEKYFFLRHGLYIYTDDSDRSVTYTEKFNRWALVTDFIIDEYKLCKIQFLLEGKLYFTNFIPKELFGPNGIFEIKTL